MTKEYIQYLEETYLVEDDFEADSEDSSEARNHGCLACGDNNGNVESGNGSTNLSSESLDDMDINVRSRDESPSAIVVPTCAHLHDLAFNDEYTGYSKYERFPCPTPAPHNSKTSLESFSEVNANTDDQTGKDPGMKKEPEYESCEKSASKIAGVSSTSGSSIDNCRTKEEEPAQHLCSLKDDLFAALEKAVSLSSHYGMAARAEPSQQLLHINSRKLQDITQDLATKGTAMVMKEGDDHGVGGGGSRPDLEEIRKSLDELEKELEVASSDRQVKDYIDLEDDQEIMTDFENKDDDDYKNEEVRNLDRKSLDSIGKNVMNETVKIVSDEHSTNRRNKYVRKMNIKGLQDDSPNEIEFDEQAKSDSKNIRRISELDGVKKETKRLGGDTRNLARTNMSLQKTSKKTVDLSKLPTKPASPDPGTGRENKAAVFNRKEGNPPERKSNTCEYSRGKVQNKSAPGIRASASSKPSPGILMQRNSAGRSVRGHGAVSQPGRNPGQLEVPGKTVVG